MAVRRWPVWVSLGVLVCGLLAALAASAMLLTRFRGGTEGGGSMAPTLAKGERFVAVTVPPDQLRRGDLVLVHAPEWGMGPFVKRVIGVGGDRVECSSLGGRLRVNGQPQAEPYTQNGEPDGLGRSYSVTVPPGRVFLLGDNRIDSLDSRFHLSDDQGTLPAAEARRVVMTSRHVLSAQEFDEFKTYLAVVTVGAVLFLLGLVALPVTIVVVGRRRRRVSVLAGQAQLEHGE